MSRYRKIQSVIVVTKPTGGVVSREVEIAHDTKLNTIDVAFKGDTILKGYIFSLPRAEMERAASDGELSDQSVES